MPPKKATVKKSTKEASEPKEEVTKKKTTKKPVVKKVAKDPKPDDQKMKEKASKTKKVTRAKPKEAENGEGDVVPEKKKKLVGGTRSKKAEESQPTKKKSEPTEESQDKVTRRKRKAPTEVKGSEKSESQTKTTKMNETDTNWNKINFKCATKNSKGQKSNFRITSWNVDGIRAWFKKGGLNIIEYGQPDIFCLQETKCGEEKLSEELKNIEGYETLWCSSDKDGYAGVGVATKIKPLSVVYGIDSEEHDSEGRCITLEYEKFYLVNVYVPNAGRKLVTLPKRLDWNDLFKAHIKKLDALKPVIICGDMNVAHEEIDLANPKTNTKNAGFTAEERNGMTDFLEDGYIDTFRHLYPDREKAYTFWTYMAKARSKNVGWRLDYFIVSKRFIDNVCDNVIHSDVLGSDHCPLTLYVNI